MAKKKKVETHKFNEDIENLLVNRIFKEEYEPSKSNKTVEDSEFESAINMLECVRAEKEYEWLSDYFYPEFPAKILTDASNWVAQYFMSRDFVEVKLDGDRPEDKAKCRAAKKLINQTLNNRNIHHYHKYVRGRLINSLAGQVYALFWWEQKTKKKVVGYKYQADEFGNKVEESKEEITDDEVLVDQMNYEIFDPRNVFTDSSYRYSIQEKPWVIFRDEPTYEELKEKEVDNGLFNLDLVKELCKRQGKTETSTETYNKNEPDKEGSKPVSRKLDRLRRFGKEWVVIKSRDADGFPEKIEPGYGEDGEPLERAELIQTIAEIIYVGTSKVLIRFQPNPFRDKRGNNYYPTARGCCYIHPTKDIGLSDGKYLRELQIPLNDHLNMGTDRVKLATLPTLKGKRNSIMDNTTIYFEPEHVMELEDPKADLEEFKISDNIDGTLSIMAMLKEGGDKVTSIFPTTMGELPGKASTTATAVAGSEQKANVRSNFKSLTYEYTFLLDSYWINLQMAWRFMHPKTAMKMMGRDAPYFDPDATYTYTPVTSSIETEFNKYRKIQNYDQTIGRLAGLVKVVPAMLPVIAHILRRQLELQGDEYQDIADMLGKLAKAQVNTEESQGQDIPNMGEVPTSNQNRVPMSNQEMQIRGQAGGNQWQ